MSPTENHLVPLDPDEVAHGVAVETGAPALIELAGELGLDWVWVDLEHKNPGPLDGRYLESVARAAECAGVEPVVRVPAATPHAVRKVRDAGIRSLVVPRVESAAEVRRAVRAAYFSHDGGPGERGLSLGRASRYGGDLTGPEYAEDEDANTLVGVLVEDVAAVDAVDDILDVPGLDFVFPGPGDLGVSMGHPLEDHPDVSDALATVERRCRARDVPMLGHLGSNFALEDLATGAAEGYALVSLGDEFDALRESIGDRLASVGDPSR